ncbi:MAG: hypothetical protein EOM21_20215 [Gammaproteobacteria bacterium]|nr:hypothetical protein [Gammaproteobacteria bacterium]
MSVQPPPIYEALADDQGKAKLAWTLFFSQMFDGDAGTDWSPLFTDLTTVGAPTITGRYYRLSKYLTFFRVLITPSTSTTSTAGTTYIGNFPLSFSNDGIVFAVSGGIGDGPGHIVAASNRIYVPGWSAVTVPLTVIGIGEAG